MSPMTGLHAPWIQQARTYRNQAASRATLDVRYGPGQAQTMDIFEPADAAPNEPIAIFFPGGGWRRLGPDEFSQAAKGMNRLGITVAVCGYDLAPSVTLRQIIDQCRAACLYLSEENDWQRLFAFGHSAGGHLAACMVATTNWQELDPAAPADLVPAGAALSGVYDVTRVLNKVTNDALQLTQEEAEALSPINWPVASGRIFYSVAGALEPAETRNDAKNIALTWKARGARTSSATLKRLNHRTIVDELANHRSALTATIAKMASRIY